MRHLMKLLAVAAVVLAVGVGLSPARADILELGGTFSYIPMTIDNTTNVTEGGGSITVSKLNSVTLDWVYCVDLFTNVYVPGTYNNTAVRYDGKILKSVSEPVIVNNAGKVAWLLNEYAGQADESFEQIALQSAIWETIYGYDKAHLNLASTHAAMIAKNDMLAALGSNTSAVSGFRWLTPMKSGSSVVYQGLVTHAVPDGGMTLMLLGGALIGLETLRRKARA